jgi:hypothetical protein
MQLSSIFILFQQFRLGYKVQLQRVATVAVIAEPGDLLQAATAIFPAITSNLVAQVLLPHSPP